MQMRANDYLQTDAYVQLFERLKGMPLFSWIELSQVKQFCFCFDMMMTSMFAGEKAETMGRVGILLEGHGSLIDKQKRDGIEIRQGDSFGFEKIRNVYQVVQETFAPDDKALVLWFNRDVLNNGCYGRGCAGGHFRINELLVSQRYSTD
jgi:hypothetical protein